VRLRVCIVVAGCLALSAVQSAEGRPYFEAGAANSSSTVVNAYPPPTQGVRGWVMVVHGGGWKGVGPSTVVQERPQALWLQSQGWATLNVDYRAGAGSLSDVLSFYDGLRSRLGRRTPICLWGSSAGGQLALLLAEMRPHVRCVITEGAPTDFQSIASQPASGLYLGDPVQFFGPRWVAELATQAFGLDGLARYSPVTAAGRLRARLLLTGSEGDFLIPAAQAKEMVARGADAQTLRLARGDLFFTHADVSTAAMHDYQHAELKILRYAQHAQKSGPVRARLNHSPLGHKAH